jgi:hypothetical protein
MRSKASCVPVGVAAASDDASDVVSMTAAVEKAGKAIIVRVDVGVVLE